MLEFFIRNRGIVLTRENLLDKIWDAEERYVEERTLNVSIRRLRKKIEDNPEEPAVDRNSQNSMSVPPTPPSHILSVPSQTLFHAGACDENQGAVKAQRRIVEADLCFRRSAL